MFRFTQEPSLGSSPVLCWNYKYGFSVHIGIDVFNDMAAYQPDGSCVNRNKSEQVL